jgi:hypothetical protein
MRKLITAVLLCSIIISIAPLNAADAFNDSPPAPQPDFAGEMICEPGAYLIEPVDCLVVGPSKIITDLAEKGISYPFLPFPGFTPSLSYNDLDRNYAKINIPVTDQARLYLSLDEAVAGGQPYRVLEPAFLQYVAYQNRVDINGGHYLQLNSGEWVRASPSSVTNFQGLAFRTTPHMDFGWVVNSTPIYVEPNTQSPIVKEPLPRYSVIQVYDTFDNGYQEWVMIGMGQWMERTSLRLVYVNTTPPEGVDRPRWIEANLYEQTFSVYENGQLVFATLMASGVEPYFTQPGLFQIYEKKPFEDMSGAFEADRSDYYYLQDVPWTMYFDKSRAIHGAYWRTLFGYPQSHGCVNLSVGDSHWLYDWAEIGDWIYVWDISGKTPTDKELYTDGGA